MVLIDVIQTKVMDTFVNWYFLISSVSYLKRKKLF